jgi:hypothetical protein
MADGNTPLKGVAWNLGFSLYKADGTVIVNPGTYTKKVWKDGGAAADIAGSVTETDTTYGQLVVQLSTSEMNADYVQVYIKDDTTGCVPFTATIYPSAGNAYAEAALVHAHVADCATATALADLHTDVGTVYTVVDGIETHVHSIDTTKMGTITNTGGTATVGAILGDFSNSALVTRVADLHTDVADVHTDVGTVGTVVDGIETHVHSIDTTKLGTIVNTGGTATVGAILGDPANTNFHTRIADLHTDVADVHTDVGTAVTDIAAVHVHAGTIETDVAAIHTHVNDLHDTDIPDLHTDLGTALTNVADLHTDLGTALTNIASILTDTGTTLDANLLLALKLLRNKTTTNPADGTMTVYDDDNTTTLYTCTVYKDVGGTAPYDGAEANRRNRLA